MKKIIDSHIHIDVNSKNPISDLINYLNENNIDKANLIVNNIDELECIKNESDSIELLNSNRDRINITAGLCKEIYNFFIKKDFLIDIKIHPRMFNYIKEDFGTIYEQLKDIRFRNIVIDTLIFDDKYDSHIGIQLGTFLARKFQDRKIILAHSGSIELLYCQMVTRNLSNIFYDLSFTSAYLNETHIRQDMINFIKHTNSRILFGSDYPSFDMKRAIESLYEICQEAKISEESLNDIFYNNANEIYFTK